MQAASALASPCLARRPLTLRAQTQRPARRASVITAYKDEPHRSGAPNKGGSGIHDPIGWCARGLRHRCRAHGPLAAPRPRGGACGPERDSARRGLGGWG